MSFNSKVQESVIQQKSTITTPVEIRRTNEEALIGDEMKRKFTQVALDINPLPTNDKEKAAIKLMVAMAYPDVDIDSIDDLQLQTIYYPQYLNGTLQKKCEALRPKMKEVLKTIKNEKQNPSDVANALLDKRLALQNESYEKLPEKQKEKLRYEAKLKFLKLVMPEQFVNTTAKEERKAVKELTTTNEALIYAFQTGKISSKEDVNAIFKDPHRIGELQYDWADAYFKEHPEKLKNPNKSNRSERRMLEAFQRGKLDEAILKESGMSDLEELYHSGIYNELKLAYLREHASELGRFGERELKILEEQALKNGGDLSGIKNVAAGTNVDTSLTEKIIETDGVDIENDEIEITNKEDLQKLTGYNEQIKVRLNECTTEDELKACIQDIRKQAQTDHEAKILDMMMNHIIAEMSEKENNILTPQFYVDALKEIGVTPHMAVATSATGNVETEKAYGDIVANSEEMTNKQKAGYTLNVTPEYQRDSQLYTVNKMTDTGIKEVQDVLPETYAKLDQTAAKEAFEHAMNSGAVSDEQKAIIARDTIDLINDADLKKFYQDLANKYNVDYNSVPPKSERTNSNTENNSTNNKVENTSFTQQEITQILQQSSQPKDFLTMAINGVQETLEIILGKTPDTKPEVQKFDSLNSAIKELKSGTKLTDVFKDSTLGVKKDLVGVICNYGKIALAQLIDAFGGETIYGMAKNKNHKDIIKKEIERIALSDSTQRADLAQIKKQEEKQGLAAKA